MLPLRLAILFSLTAAGVADAQSAGPNPLQVASPNGQIVFVLSPASLGQAALTLLRHLP